MLSWMLPLRLSRLQVGHLSWPQELGLGQGLPLNMCCLHEKATPEVAAGTVAVLLWRGPTAPLDSIFLRAAGLSHTDVNAAQVAEQAAGATPGSLVRTCLWCATSAVQARGMPHVGLCCLLHAARQEAVSVLSMVLPVGVGSPERHFEASVTAVYRVRRCLSPADNSRKADASATWLLSAQTCFSTVTASWLQRLWLKLLQCCRQPQRQVEAAIGHSIGGPLDHRRRLQGMQPRCLHNVLAAADSRGRRCELAISPDDSNRQQRFFLALIHFLRRGKFASLAQQHFCCARAVLLAPAQQH